MSFIQLSANISGFLETELPDLAKFWHWLMAMLSRLKSAAITSTGALALSIALFSVMSLGLFGTGNDDGFISLVYSANLAAGHGLVYNPGYEPVEGFTNLLLVLIGAIFHLVLPFDMVPQAVMATCVVAGMVMLVIFHQLAGRAFGWARGSLATGLVACCPALAYWAVSVLETLMVVLSIVWFLYQTEVAEDRRVSRANLALLSAAVIFSLLVRADGFLVPMLLVIFFLKEARKKEALVTAGTLVLIGGAHFLWRYLYFGAWLPNTATAKVDGPIFWRITNAIGTLADTVIVTGLWLPLLGLLVLLITELRNSWVKSSVALSFTSWYFVAWMGYYLFVGGDVYNIRPLLSFFPLGIYALFRATQNVEIKDLSFKLITATILSVCCLMPASFYRPYQSIHGWLTLGDYLEKNYSGQSIGFDAAGMIAWRFQSAAWKLDMLGLNDKHIASLQPRGGPIGHNKSDMAYVFEQNPDLIATWFDDNNNRQYEQTAGYHLTLLVNVIDGGIRNVSGSEESEIKNLLEQGYTYGVWRAKT